MEKSSVKDVVNQCFSRKGVPKVKNFAAEFADGILFQKLFNILYDEKVDCKLVKSALVDDRVLNWNRINASICFNYLQQSFYLVSPTMKTLAQGKNQTAILKLLGILIQTSQSNYGAANLDDAAIRDIADVYEQDGPDGNAEAGQPTRGAIAMEEKRSDQFAHLEEELKLDNDRDVIDVQDGVAYI